jgi:pyochelin biosynthesis protein PchC
MDALLEVSCPMCGGLIEAPNEDELVRLSRLHTLDAHHYDVPAEHVLTAMVASGELSAERDDCW